jgi:hypothetical protein
VEDHEVDDDGKLRDSEVALMDMLKLVFEVIVAKGLSSPETIATALETQMRQYPKVMPRAIYVVE